MTQHTVTSMTPRNAPQATDTKSPNVFVRGAFLYYRPTFSPALDPKEWGGRWDAKIKAYRLPRLRRYIGIINDYDPKATVDESLNAWVEYDYANPGALDMAQGMPTSYVKLYPYQREAVKRITQSKMHGQMLALSPGLGKTPTSIVSADVMKAKRVLVIAPLSLIPNWMREIETWSSDSATTKCHGTDPADTRWVVTNYDSIRLRLDAYAAVKWDLIICDESVLLKNRKAQRTQRIKTLCTMSANKVLFLSGAPVTRDNSDIWSQFNIIQPEYFTSFWRFTHETCVVQQTEWGVQIVGSRANVNLVDEYPEIMFVRNQEQVLPDLPEIRYQDVEVPLTKKQRKMHDDLMASWIAELEGSPSHQVSVPNAIAELVRLQQITSNLRNLESHREALAARGIKQIPAGEWPDEAGKADVLCDLLDSGELELPMLIWVQWRHGAQALHDRLVKMTESKQSAIYGKRIGMVRGGGGAKSDATIEAYKAGEIDILILSLGVGKYGHTLINTRTIVYYDKSWDSDAYFQSQYRVRRNGLTHSPHCISLRARGTVDEFVELNLAGKLPSMAKTTGADLAKILRSLGEDRVALA